MEQFKKLKWSWDKVDDKSDEQKQYNLDFNTISNHDILARTINEIHKAVLPERGNYRLFKSPEEINSGHFSNESFLEPTDPRPNKTRVLKPSSELISDYGYRSQLSTSEQKYLLLNLSHLSITHNPILLRKIYQNHRQQLMTPESKQSTLEKHKIEADHFNKCTEIFYHRNPLRVAMNTEMKSYLISRWTELEGNAEEYKRQIITRILRDQVCEQTTQVELQKTLYDDFNHEAYLISKENFPSLDRFSCEDLKFCYDIKHKSNSFENPANCEITISLDLLTKLLARDEQFTVKFETRVNSIGKKCTTFMNPLPLKQVSGSNSLEVIVREKLILSLDWYNMNNFVKESTEQFKSYQAQPIESVMRNYYTKFLNFARVNETRRTWKMAQGVQSFEFSVIQSDSYFLKNEDNVLIPANISIKLEHQTKFGAERMTRDELLREWTRQTFNPGSVTLRFRIDAVSLTILSISCLTTQEIEEELKKFYNTNPNISILGNIAIVFQCFQRLPEGDYMVETAINDSCSKLLIYISTLQVTSIAKIPWEISDLLSNKWIPIDECTPSFLHQNHPPSSFPFVPGKPQLSYLSQIKSSNASETNINKARDQLKPPKPKKRKKSSKNT